MHGVVDSVSLQSLILDVRGVGYQVFCSNNLLSQLSVGQDLKVYTYHHVREDDERLFGFATLDEHDLFVKFLTVDGVGPKVALAIFSTYSYAQICDGLHRGDERFFAAVSGLGKKTAAKIVIELRGKVDGRTEIADRRIESQDDVVDALVALGYAERDIFGVMQEIDKNKSVDEQIKEALRRMIK